MDEYTLVEGQCGTCRFAQEFGFAASPSGPNDGVHCTSEALAKELDKNQNPDDPNDEVYNFNQKELESYGFMDLWRLEAVAEASVRCNRWAASDAWLARETTTPPK